MPIGPDGQKRPTDVVANALHVARLATRETEEEYVDQAKRRGGIKGGVARAGSLSPERRSEIAQHAAAKRWSTDTS